MNTPENLNAFRNAAHQCAMQMMENALYIQKELPPVKMPDDIRAKTQTMCGSLIETKHDIITELFELEEEANTASALSDLIPNIDLIMKWLAETVREMCDVVDAVRDASDRDDRFSLGFLLLSESATNVLNAFNAASDAAKAIKEEAAPNEHAMNYTVYVDDNFNFMDEDERALGGRFETYEEATKKCMAIVDASLDNLDDGSITAKELYESYTSHGEDPFISPNPPEGAEPFSAWQYAKERCEEICGADGEPYYEYSDVLSVIESLDELPESDLNKLFGDPAALKKEIESLLPKRTTSNRTQFSPDSVEAAEAVSRDLAMEDEVLRILARWGRDRRQLLDKTLGEIHSDLPSFVP